MGHFRQWRLRLRTILSRLAARLRRKRPRAEEKARPKTGPYVNRIVSDAILFNEIPSPTENEQERVGFLTQKLSEFDISEVNAGSSGNLSFVHPAFEGTDDHILLFANTENEAYSPLQSLVRLTDRRATGSGIADNSLGVATLLVLAEYLHKNDIRFASNLVFLFTPLGGAGPSALEGFLKGWTGGLTAALAVSGLRLGDVETRPLGNCRLTATVRVPERPVFPDSGGRSAVSVLAGIASQLGSVRWAEGGETVLNIARMRAGVGHGYYPSEGSMDVEIYSTSASVLEIARNAAAATIQNSAREAGAQVEIATSASTPVTSAESNRWLVDALQGVHRDLGIRSRVITTAAPAAVVSALGVPAISVGITSGQKTLMEEFIEIAPIETGFRQLLLLLERIARQERRAS